MGVPLSPVGEDTGALPPAPGWGKLCPGHSCRDGTPLKGPSWGLLAACSLGGRCSLSGALGYSTSASTPGHMASGDQRPPPASGLRPPPEHPLHGLGSAGLNPERGAVAGRALGRPHNAGAATQVSFLKSRSRASN